jgi:TRAP-type mannitol/chloroaromatic compound transport system permease small subunit
MRKQQAADLLGTLFVSIPLIIVIAVIAYVVILWQGGL